MPNRLLIPSKILLASMGPQLYRCGNAAPVLPYGALHDLASMGPQLYRCGNVPAGDTYYCQWRELQWGRNFIVAEISLWVAHRPPPHFASMGPQLYRCGNAIGPDKHSQGVHASMGPQLYRCGNILFDLYNSANSIKLQWGRNFIVAEIR